MTKAFRIYCAFVIREIKSVQLSQLFPLLIGNLWHLQAWFCFKFVKGVGKNKEKKKKETQRLKCLHVNCKTVLRRASFRCKRWLDVKRMGIYHLIKDCSKASKGC